MKPPFAYPRSPRVAYTETRHGQALNDPFHWLEGPETGDVADWTRAQQALTDAVFAASPREAAIRDWLDRFLGHPYVFHAVDTATRLFLLEDRPGDAQPVLIARDHADGRERVVVGPDELAAIGADLFAQEAVFPSPGGRYVAYYAKSAGSDFVRLRIKEVDAGIEVGADFPETALGSVSWTPDERILFYNQNQGGFIAEARRAARPDGLWRHEIGSPVGDDRLVHAMTWAPAHAIIPTVSDDGRWLFVNQIQLVADVSALGVLSLEPGGRPASEAIDLAPKGEAAFNYVGERAGRYFFETNLGAGRGQVVGFELDAFPAVRRVEAVAEQAAPLARSTRSVRSEHAVFANGRFYLTLLDGPRHRIGEFGVDGRWLRDLPLPPASSVAGQGGDRYGDLSAAADGGLLIDLWTYTQAPCAWRFDPADDSWSLVAPDRPAPALSAVETELVFYPAADGTPIPATIIALKDTPRDGAAPVLLYAYGAAGMAITPEFGLDIVAWVAAGGVYVIANIRGGGEYGEAWHLPATLAGKALTFDDFRDAARFLIARGLASPRRLGIRGLSAGGLTVGAAMTREPELFGAVIAELPLLDPLSAGRDYWSAQLAHWLGDPTADPAAFAYVGAYSPLQNLKPGRTYPPALVVMADGDAQLLSDGARKFIATLQSLAPDDGPHLLHVLRHAGHGGWSKQQQLDVVSREIAFLAERLEGRLNIPPELR